MMFKTFEVKESGALLDYLVARSGISKKKLFQSIKQGLVQVDGAIVKQPKWLLSQGEVITLEEPSDAPFTILYEDHDLIAIDKPSGLLSVGTDREKEKTCYHKVSQYLKSKNRQAKVFVVHRLDQYTSGVLLFAKNASIQKQLQADWNDRVKQRGYIALVEGTFKQPTGTLKDYLYEDQSQMVRVGNKNHGKLAITHYKVLSSHKGESLVELSLDTGRKNQIRVQMAQSGHPLIGDHKYNPGGRKAARLCLHAHKIQFVDPRNQKIITIESKCPKF